MTDGAFDERDAAMSALLGIRSSIDNIDAALIHLLAERFKFTQQVGRLKARARAPAERSRPREAPDRPVAGARHRRPPRPGVRREVVQLRRRRGHPAPRGARRRRHLGRTVSWYPIALPSQSGRRVLVTGANKGIGFFTAARMARRRRCPRGAQRAQRRAARGRGSRHPRRPARDIRRDARHRHVVARLGAGGCRGCSPTAAARRRRRERRHGAPAARAPRIGRRQRARARDERARALRAARRPDCRTSRPARASCRSGRSRRCSRRSAPTTCSSPRDYDSWRAYAQSKIASQVVAFELDRRLRAADVPRVERRRPPRLLDRRANAARARRERAEHGQATSPTRCRRRGRRASTAAPRPSCTRSPRPASRAASSGGRDP